MNFINKYFAVLTAFIVFIIYLITLAPSVIQIDSGELAAVQATLGIAHPTGYPLFSVFGYIWLLLPLPLSVIYQANLFAAVLCALTAGIFSYSSKMILDNLSLFGKSKSVPKIKNKQKKKRDQVKEKFETKAEFSNEKNLIAASAGGFILAFSRTFWFQSTSVEVYSLHLLFLSLIIFTLIKSYINSSDERISKYWLIFSFFLALGFANHMTTLLILPGIAYLYFGKYRFTKFSFKQLLIMILLFTPLLILFYSYLPFRASQNPEVNWGNPVDLERIMRHISGKQYQVWIFSSTESAKRQLSYFISNLPNEMNISLFFSAAGLISSFIFARKLFVFLLIAFLSTVLYSINYDITDIDSYFLLAYISLAYFAVLGIVKLLQYVKFKKYSYTIISALTALFIIIQIYINFNNVNQSGIYTFEDYTKNLLGSTSKNAIILSYQWDYFISASYYYQFVENYRKDVAVIDKELLRRSWYYNQISRSHPAVLKSMNSEISLFLDALMPFERDEAYNSNLLENLYRKIMSGLVETNLSERDIYIGPELFDNEMQKGEFTLPPGYNLVPDLFLFKVVKGIEYVPAADPDFEIRFPENRNVYIDYIERFCGNMLARRALYEMQFDKIERAKVYVNKLKSNFPNYPIPDGIAKALR